MLSSLSFQWSDSKSRTFLLIYLAAMVEKADEALLPAVYNEVGEAFMASPTKLGALTLARSLSQALSNPLAAYLSLEHDRTTVVALGTFIWALSTSVGGFAVHYNQVCQENLWKSSLLKLK